ncbi:MAG: mannose-1-phosphate guanylyltransferase [Nannocystis sp.]|nr:mannose-1-phosphate guanylyltransferase [Nannocystis sp.]
MSEPFVVVMAGGNGARLWPASTPDHPKHLLGLAPGAASLLATTLDRARAWAASQRTFVVTTAAQRPAILALTPELPPEHIIAEPAGRNTAPCLHHAMLRVHAALRAADWSPAALRSAVVLALPADHHIRDPRGLDRALRAAIAHAAAAQEIVTLGVQPTAPDTGYGYIERAEQPLHSGSPALFHARRFIEKPDAARAREFFDSGRFLWNAGIFAFPLLRTLAAIDEHAPELAAAFAPVAAALAIGDDAALTAALTAAYDRAPAQPIDVALLEKLPDLRVIPVEIGWDDLGSWAAVHALAERDLQGNAALAPPGVTLQIADSQDTLVWSDDAEIAVLGVRGLAVIASGGKILVCPLDRAQEIRALAAHSAAQRRREP